MKKAFLTQTRNMKKEIIGDNKRFYLVSIDRVNNMIYDMSNMNISR